MQMDGQSPSTSPATLRQLGSYAPFGEGQFEGVRLGGLIEFRFWLRPADLLYRILEVLADRLTALVPRSYTRASFVSVCVCVCVCVDAACVRMLYFHSPAPCFQLAHTAQDTLLSINVFQIVTAPSCCSSMCWQ